MMNDDDCFCDRYMQAMSHGYACKCPSSKLLGLDQTHNTVFCPKSLLALLFAHAVASTAICSKKAIPKTPVLSSAPSKSAENLQGWRSHMHVMLAMLVGNQAVHNSCMNKTTGGTCMKALIVHECHSGLRHDTSKNITGHARHL